MLSVTAHSHSTNEYRRSCSSSAERVGLVDAALARAENYTTQKSLRPCYHRLLQAGSLRSGSVSHLNKHGPAEDGGEFVEALKETAPLNESGRSR